MSLRIIFGQSVNAAGLDLAGGLHGAEHAIIALMPLHVMCDRWDIGGLSSPMFGENGEPVIFVYDAYEGGIGLAEKAYEVLPALLTSAYELVRDCTCEKGCPSCIYSPKCGNDNQPLDKEATILILGELCHEPANPGTLPWILQDLKPCCRESVPVLIHENGSISRPGAVLFKNKQVIDCCMQGS